MQMTPAELQEHFLAALLLLMRGCEAEGMEPSDMVDVLGEVTREIYDEQAVLDGQFEQVSSSPTLAPS